MVTQPKRLKKILPEISISKMIPNIVTISAMSFGLSSIYFALQKQNTEAVTVLLIAMLLDGLDGSIARAINATSDIGGELDSLSDMVNFGVCPTIITYIISMHNWIKFGWGICLFYCICCCFRLARFNVLSKTGQSETTPQNFFLGIPAPAGAAIAILPIIYHLALGENSTNINPVFFTFSLIIAGLLMISKIPTIALKNWKIKKTHLIQFAIIVSLTVALMVMAVWIVLCSMISIYVITIPVFYHHIRKKQLTIPDASG